MASGQPRSTERTALVVGASKGLGLEWVRCYLAHGWRVVATWLEPSPALDALQADYADRLAVHPLDIMDTPAVRALRSTLEDCSIDVLHIVAGVFQASMAPIWEQPDTEILRVLKTNAIAGVHLAELFATRVPPGGCFAFTSSGMGSMARNDRGDVDLYRISKAALNMLVRSFGARHAGEGKAAVLFCPGWAKTDMGGPDATVEAADSVAGMYRWIEQAAEDPAGPQFREYSGEIVPW